MSDADRYWGLSNPGPGNLLVWLEPWADELEVAARSTVILKAPSGPEEGALGEVEWAPDHLVVWASAQTVEAFIDGVLQNTSSALIPVPNGLTKDLLNVLFGDHPAARLGGGAAGGTERISWWRRMKRRLRM